MADQNFSDPLLSVQEVADILRVDGTTVRRWINNGVLDAVVLPHAGNRRAFRVKKSTLDGLMQTSVK